MKDNLILQTHELKKSFGRVCAVNGVSLQVERGQVYGFLGPNGSGKTTTIGMILGLLTPLALLVGWLVSLLDPAPAAGSEA